MDRRWNCRARRGHRRRPRDRLHREQAGGQDQCDRRSEFVVVPGVRLVSGVRIVGVVRPGVGFVIRRLEVRISVPSSASGSSAPKNPGEGDAPASAAQGFLDDLTKGASGYPSAASQVCAKYRQVFLQAAKNGQYAKLEGKSPKTGKVSPKATDAVTVAYAYQGGSGSVPMIRDGDTWQVCPTDQNPGSVI